MAWTTPRTWVPGELVTALMMNTHVRDNFNALKTGFPHTSYSPTIGDGLTLGNGSVVGEYAQFGPFVFVRITVTFGTGTSWSGGAPGSATLPITGVGRGGGQLRFSDAGVNIFLGILLLQANIVQFYNGNQSAATSLQIAYPTSSAPFSWTQNDVISTDFWYATT